MTTTLKAEAEGILRLSGYSDFEMPVESCDAGLPDRTDDDTCRIEGRTIRFDDLFILSNARNLERGNPAALDTRNYFFRLDPNAVFFRRESVDRNNLGEGGLLYRTPGSSEWRRLDFQEINASAELKAALVPILLGLVGSRSDYDRLNGAPHHGDDYGYARAKAVMWLNNFVPKGNAAYAQALLRAFPTLNADAAHFAYLRLKEEGGSVLQSLVPILVALRSDPAKRAMADRMLGEIAPSISPEDRSTDTAVRPFFSWEGFGAVYIPWYGRAPAGLPWSNEREAVGSYTAAAGGLGLCIGPRFECARREGFRVGLNAEIGRMLNGFGYVYGGGHFFAGNENVVGFLDAGANWYPTGGFTGDKEVTPAIGAGVRVIPSLKYFPISLRAGFRMDPTDPRNGGVHFGLGGAQ